MSDAKHGVTSSSLRLSFGAMTKKLWEQLDEQGFAMDTTHMEGFQRDLDALARCKVRGLLPESQVNRAASRLLDRIARCARATGATHD